MDSPKICYNILFKTTSESILTLSQDPKWLGVKIGITSTLHTWGQNMEFHTYIHSGSELKIMDGFPVIKITFLEFKF